jgi:hypothetical protein
MNDVIRMTITYITFFVLAGLVITILLRGFIGRL